MRFLITAGGTREYIDPVRFISNASSGRMGYELARSAIAAGHKVTLISAPFSLKAPKGVKFISVVSAADMYRQVRRCFAKCDCLVMAAAVADYTPVVTSSRKMKKSSSALTLRLKPTADILKWAGHHRKKQVVVGFALEDTDVLRRAESKLTAKSSDMIVANVPAAIGAENSALAVKTAGSDWLFLGSRTKSSSAKKLIALIEVLATGSAKTR